jgi:hypothetical protein
MKDKIPVLKCFIEKNGSEVKVWCPFCKKYHCHGLDHDLENGKKSHRSSHCNIDESPFNHGGYYLKLYSQR